MNARNIVLKNITGFKRTYSEYKSDIIKNDMFIGTRKVKNVYQPAAAAQDQANKKPAAADDYISSSSQDSN